MTGRPPVKCSVFTFTHVIIISGFLVLLLLIKKVINWRAFVRMCLNFVQINLKFLVYAPHTLLGAPAHNPRRLPRPLKEGPNQRKRSTCKGWLQSCVVCVFVRCVEENVVCNIKILIQSTFINCDALWCTLRNSSFLYSLSNVSLLLLR